MACFPISVTPHLAGDALVRTGLVRRIDASVAFVFPIVAVLLLSVRRVAIALALTALAVGLWIAAIYVAFEHGYWLSIAIPGASAIPFAVGYGITRLWAEQRSSRKFALEGDALRPFQPPRLIALLTRDPHFLARPVQQQAAVVFVDLSGFTGVSEALGAAWTRELLAALHERIEATTTDLQGFVVSYMGDGAMIVFGIPAPRPDEAWRALCAVNRLHDSLSNWCAELPLVARHRLAPRVGADFGPVVLSQGIAGVGAIEHVAAMLLQRQTGTRFQIVPYRGNAPAMQDLVAGQIDMMIADAATALPHVGSGRIKALAVMAKTRMAAAPDIPTVDEAGLPEFYASLWYGLWAPKNTPNDIITKLNAAAVNALADLTIRKRLAELGQDVPPPAEQTPQALGARQRAEIEKWWPIIKAANIRAE
jgi:Tripartite tricarboxylate transporter family receptor/Adenylate and Guanylate cyclase catalytic domain